MVYGMVYRAWHGIWYDLEGMAGYIIWPGGHGMVLPGEIWDGIWCRQAS